LIGNVLISLKDNPHGGIEIGIWRATQDTPDGMEESTGFSLPRNFALPKDNFGKRTREYYEARDVENGWKNSVVTTFLAWRDKQDKAKLTGGSVVRLVKKQAA
jgi:hypothetical protein